VFGAIAGTGGALGLLVGGTVTEYAQWRWCLYVNVPIAVVAFLGGRQLLPRTAGHRGSRLDTPGVLLVSGGLVALVYGCSKAASQGWSSAGTLAAVALGAGLIGAFVVLESKVTSPLLPLHIVTERNRGGSYLGIGLAVVAMYGLFLLLTYDFQVVQHYTPARAGLAFLPLSAAVMVSSTAVSRTLLPRVPPRWLMAPGLLVGAAGMAVLAGVHAHAAYVSHVLPAELLLGLGMGAVFVPAFSTATAGVGPREAGVASAMANTAQQVGASVGTALLNTIAASATTRYLVAHANNGRAAALVHGYGVAAMSAAVVLCAAALMVGVLVTSGRPDRQTALTGSGGA
jgi:hypothetical protein